ncbi:MAG: hypothetical protein AAFU85_32765 [Planctomycetota bacterium]
MTATVFRAQTIFFLPELSMFGGKAPDGWFAPWLSDSIIGLLVPLVVYLFWTQRGVRIWGLIATYNAVGAFDYANGLAAQWISPMPAEMASPTTVYLGIGVFMALQLIVFALMLRPDVVRHFTQGEDIQS